LAEIEAEPEGISEETKYKMVKKLEKERKKQAH
jgi:hypothetical protein